MASAGDDGNVLLWTQSDKLIKEFGQDSSDFEDSKETWKLKNACRSNTSEIYDLNWSPNSKFIITGSMDNIARIYNSSNCQCIRQIAEHNHYIQGVAWDPKNEFLATQSSDRSIHIYSLKDKDGLFTLNNYYKFSKSDVSSRKLTSASSSTSTASMSTLQSPKSKIFQNNNLDDDIDNSFHHQPIASPMRPPSHSRKLSTSSTSSIRTIGTTTTTVSPNPLLLQSSSASSVLPIPLPAVRTMESPLINLKQSSIFYHNETLPSFFRRLTFSPDGSLLFTPSGLFKTSSTNSNSNSNLRSNSQSQSSPSIIDLTTNTNTLNNDKEKEKEQERDEISNTVFIYSRAGLNKPPIAHLPGLKKPSVAISFSPIFYKLRKTSVKTQNLKLGIKNINISEGENSSISKLKIHDKENKNSKEEQQPVFKLPYRMIYAVATQDTVIIYDTQQKLPIGIATNLHYAIFTDLSWSNDGNTLLITSTDGFCSVVVFKDGLLGEVYNIDNNVNVYDEKLINNDSLIKNNYNSLPPPPTTPKHIDTFMNHNHNHNIQSFFNSTNTNNESNIISSSSSSSPQKSISDILTPTVSTIPSVVSIGGGFQSLTTPPHTPSTAQVSISSWVNSTQTAVSNNNNNKGRSNSNDNTIRRTDTIIDIDEDIVLISDDEKSTENENGSIIIDNESQNYDNNINNKEYTKQERNIGEKSKDRNQDDKEKKKKRRIVPELIS